MSDDAHLQNVRAALPAVHEYAYLNAGSYGPLAQPAIDAMAAAAAQQAARGRIRFEVMFNEELPRMQGLRRAFARLLGANDEEIALARSTTDGMNTAIWGQPWQAGDEIVVTDLEHEGGTIPAYLAARKFGLKLRTLRLLDAGPAGMADIVARELGPRSRLLSISHVSWANGVRLPLAEITGAAHAAGCKVAVDGAQSAGAIPIDVHALGVDYYAVPGQKWLCGPEGSGALYVRREEQEGLLPTFGGFLSLDFEHPHAWDCFGQMQLADTARRYEIGTTYLPAVHGMLAGLEWMEQEVGWEWAFARVSRLHAYARQRLAQNPALDIFTPAAAAGLLHFYLPEQADPEAVNTALVRRGIRIRTIPHMKCLRISTGFWNTEEELEAVAAALEEILPHKA